MTKKYQSVTCWQGQDGYEIEVTFGEFDDVASAAKFGKMSAKKNQIFGSKQEIGVAHRR